MEMLQCRFILSSLLVLNGCFYEASCQTIFTYTSKDAELLPCAITNETVAVTWSDLVAGSQVRVLEYSIGDPPKITISTEEKYRNFDYTMNTTSFNLVIRNVEDEDGGSYTCTPVGIDLSTIDVTVEAIPDEISLDCFVPPDVTCPAQDVTPTSELVCTCAAKGVYPGTLSLDISGAENVQQDSTAANDDLVDLSLTATVPVTDFMTEVTCSVKGYSTTGEPIPPNLITKKLVISPPTCALEISFDKECKGATLNCSCSAIPTDGESTSDSGMVFSYFNGTGDLIQGETTNTGQINDIEAGVDLTYSCRGCNGLYYGGRSYVTESKVCTITTESTTEKSESTTTKKSGGLTTGAKIGISLGAVAVVVVIVVVAVILWKNGICCCKSESDKLDDNGAGPAVVTEPPTYGKIDRNRTKDPTPAPRSSMRDSKNPSNPKQDGPMEMQYADLDHGNKPQSNEVIKPKDEPTEYATVQSVIV